MYGEFSKEKIEALISLIFIIVSSLAMIYCVYLFFKKVKEINKKLKESIQSKEEERIYKKYIFKQRVIIVIGIIFLTIYIIIDILNG